jgi:hypothetical protein
MAECLEEIQLAVRHYLQSPANPGHRDRLATAVADAHAVLHDLPRPRRSFAVEEADHVGDRTDIVETPEQRGSRLLMAATSEELGAAAVRGAQREKGAGTLNDLWEKADAGPRTDGVMSLEDMDDAKGRRGKPKTQKGAEGTDIKAGIRAHMTKKHGKRKS